MKNWLKLLLLFPILSFRSDVSKYESRTYPYAMETYGRETSGRPLLLYLHSSNERGVDINLVYKYGPLKAMDLMQNYNFVVIAPQCTRGEWWSAPKLSDFVKEMIDTYQFDKRRIYVTGIGMGGFGTWDLAMTYPDLITAIVPISGEGDSARVCNMGKIPVWAFHGSVDPIIPIKRSQILVDQLQSCGGNARLTLLKSAENEIAAQMYSTNSLYDWLLQQTKSE